MWLKSTQDILLAAKSGDEAKVFELIPTNDVNFENAAFVR